MKKKFVYVVGRESTRRSSNDADLARFNMTIIKKFNTLSSAATYATKMAKRDISYWSRQSPEYKVTDVLDIRDIAKAFALNGCCGYTVKLEDTTIDNIIRIDKIEA